MNREYMILDIIAKKENITQRELSKNIGLSLGTVNILLSKMVKEGLIKVEKANASAIRYILTPKGILEKANKTYQYIKIHYQYIEEKKQRIKNALLDILEKEGSIILILNDDEISNVVKLVINELKTKDKDNIIVRSKKDNISVEVIVIAVNRDDYDEYKNNGYNTINLLEKI